MTRIQQDTVTTVSTFPPSFEVFHGDNLTLVENGGQRGGLPKTPSNVWAATGVIIILIVSLVINLKVLFTITMLPKRKRHRPASVLVAHFSSVAIVFAFVTVLLVAESTTVIDLTGPKLCHIVSFLKNVISSVFSLNIIVIIVERFRIFQRYHGEKLLVYRLILLMWTTAVVGGIPSAFLVAYSTSSVSDYKEDKESDNTSITVNLTKDNSVGGSQEDLRGSSGSCKSVPLFGSVVVTILYELLRFLLFHVSVVCYMTFAMCKIRSKVAHIYILKPIPNERMRRKVQSIRFIYIHFVIFIVIWLPFGFLVFAHRVLSRWPKPATNISDLLIVLGLLFTVYLVLNPLIYLCLMEEVGWCCCKVTRNSKRSRDSSSVYRNQPNNCTTGDGSDVDNNVGNRDDNNDSENCDTGKMVCRSDALEMVCIETETQPRGEGKEKKHKKKTASINQATKSSKLGTQKHNVKSTRSKPFENDTMDNLSRVSTYAATSSAV